MAELEELVPNYRRAQERWPNAPTLSSCQAALVTCFKGDQHGLVEHIKSFIESVCVTILTEFREPLPSSSPSTTELLVAALRPLGLQNTRGAAKLDKVLSGFNKLTDALSEMRNEHGGVAHGKDGFLAAVTADHARAFLHTGDAILSIILNALEGKEPDLSATREPYERFEHLNECIDRAVSVEARVDDEGERPIVVFSVAAGPKNEAIEIRVQPSRLLYGLDRGAYLYVLRAAAEVVPEKEEQITGAPAVTQPNLARAESAIPETRVVPAYVGRLSAMKDELGAFLQTEGWQSGKVATGGTSLLDSLLATADKNAGLDWKSREQLVARLKVTSKRVLVQFGFGASRAEAVAARLVEWMKVHISDEALSTEPT